MKLHTSICSALSKIHRAMHWVGHTLDSVEKRADSHPTLRWLYGIFILCVIALLMLLNNTLGFVGRINLYALDRWYLWEYWFTLIENNVIGSVEAYDLIKGQQWHTIEKLYQRSENVDVFERIFRVNTPTNEVIYAQYICNASMPTGYSEHDLVQLVSKFVGVTKIQTLRHAKVIAKSEQISFK